uniref:Uncharacterized protein n=1 Tax=Oryza nivara TaxID=4536 RepID=A0A0E0IIX4_ORYNI
MDRRTLLHSTAVAIDLAAPFSEILCKESRGDSRASGSVCKTVACAKGGMREGIRMPAKGLSVFRRTSVTSTADCAESPRSV